MRQFSDPLKAHYHSNVTTIAICWKLTCKNNRVLAFTSHDQDITIDDIVYEAASGFSPTVIASGADLNEDNLSVQGVLNSERITSQDVLAGHYDYAEIEIFEVNYQDISQGTLTLQTGWLGEVRMNGSQFEADIYGLTYKLSATIGSLYSRTCRATLGDASCGVDIDARTVTGSVTDIITQTYLRDSQRREENGLFSHGTLHFTGGENKGISIEISQYNVGELRLTSALPYNIALGDTYRLTQGCDKQFNTCITRFNNAINFRGEPHVPGLDKILETAATRNA